MQQPPQQPTAQTGLHHDPKTVVRLAVTVHRATNLEIGAVTWSYPWVVASLGSARSRSRECKVKDGTAEVHWTTELRHTGDESYLTFAVHTGEFQVIGLSIVPVAEIFKHSVFSKAIPLLRNGHTRRGFGDDDKSTELCVTVRCIHAEAGVDSIALRHRASDELWSRSAQVRIVIRALHLAPICMSDRGAASHRPYVLASLGVQEYKTMTARKCTQREAEEFVFCPPKRPWTCDEFLASEVYEGPLRDPGKGSWAVPAYRKKADEEMHVQYRDVWFIFWLAQQSLLKLEVLDDHTFSRDKPLAWGSLDFVDLFQRLLSQGGAGALAGDAGRANLGSIAVPLLTRSQDLDDAAAGSLEVEVEFLREPLALPSQLEGTFRGLNKIIKQRTERRREANRQAEAVVSAARPGSRAGGALPEAVRGALARLLTTVAITDTRQCLQHEEDSAAAIENLTNAVQVLAGALALPEQQSAELLAEARAMTCAGAEQEQVVGAYRSACSQNSVSELLPFAELLQELLRSFGGYSAKVYSTIMRAGAAVQPQRSDSRMFVEAVERQLVLAMQGDAVPTIPDPDHACQSSTRLVQTAKDLVQDETSQVEGEAPPTSWSSFLPTVDSKRLSDSRRPHTGDVYTLMTEYEHRVFYGTAAAALLAGILGGVSTIALGRMLRLLEYELCSGKIMWHVFGLRDAACWFMKKQSFDDVIVDIVSSTVGFSTFALTYFIMYGYEAYTRLYQRYSVVKEIALEPLGPPNSFHAVLCASGFLTSLSDLFTPWEVDADCPWTNGQVIAVRYETSALMRLGFELVDALAWATKSTYWVVMSALYCSNPVSFSCLVMDWLLAECNDLYDVACSRADQVGKRLAGHLVQSYAGIGRPVRPVSLVGFSTGAVAMYSCLKELHRLHDSGEAPVAANIVCDVVLLGAPLSVDDPSEWQRLRPLASGRLVVGYLHNDMTLISHKARRGIGVMMGVEGLYKVPGVENVAMSDFITRHVDYAKQMPAIMAHVMRS